MACLLATKYFYYSSSYSSILLDKFDFLDARLNANRLREPKPKRRIEPAPFEIKRRIVSYNSVKQNPRHVLYIMNEIKQHGVKYVSEKFKIPQSTLYGWRQRTWAFGRLRRHGGGRKPLLREDQEIQLNSWIIARRDRKLVVTSQNVKDKAKLMNPAIKASDKWLQGFLNRHQLSLRTPTIATSKLYPPNELREMLINFWQSVLLARQQFSVEVKYIGNMDEVPIYFEMPPRKVINKRGAKTVVVKTSGDSRKRITVVLAVMADGTKLPPMIIFKGKTPLSVKGVVLSNKVAYIAFQENAWNTAQLTRTWFDKIWYKHVGTNQNLLVWDEFKGHVQCEFTRKDDLTHRVLVPPSCTPIVQPLDVSINKAYKQHFRAIHDRWRLSQTSFERPTKQMVANWVVAAWNRVPKELVEKSFKVCGISNNLNGLEESSVSINVTRMTN